MTEILTLLPEGSGWWVLGVLIILIFGGPAVLSQETAKSRLWLIGAAARWVQTRKEKSVDRERRIEQVRADHMDSKIADLSKALERDRAEHRSEIQHMRSELDDERTLRRRIESKLEGMLAEAMDYIEDQTAWSRSVLIAARQHGWHPPLPAWESFPEWKARRSREPPPNNID